MDLKLLKKLVGGAEKIFGNADALYREAVLLANNKAWSRALFLHQISMEECAKIEVLGIGATGLLVGYKVDFEKVAEVFRSHKKKNEVNAYFLETSGKEKAARRSGQVEDAVAAFDVIQRHFHERSNLDKNAALYVDLQGEQFKAPAERITPRMVARIGKLNERFLILMAHKLELLQNYERHPEKHLKRAAAVKGALDGFLAGDAKDLEQAFLRFVDEYVKRGGE